MSRDLVYMRPRATAQTNVLSTSVARVESHHNVLNNNGQLNVNVQQANRFPFSNAIVTITILFCIYF